MILSYGLHWTISRVDWGKPGVGNSGTLLGAASRGRKARPVDFRMQRGIYALYADYQLVYVGQTGSAIDRRLFARLKDHKRDHLSERWDRFSWFGIQSVTKQHRLRSEADWVGKQEINVALNIMEAVSIAIAEPRLNLQRGKWGEANKYFQYWKRAENEQDEDD